MTPLAEEAGKLPACCVDGVDGVMSMSGLVTGHTEGRAWPKRALRGSEREPSVIIAARDTIVSTRAT